MQFSGGELDEPASTPPPSLPTPALRLLAVFTGCLIVPALLWLPAVRAALVASASCACRFVVAFLPRSLDTAASVTAAASAVAAIWWTAVGAGRKVDKLGKRVDRLDKRVTKLDTKVDKGFKSMHARFKSMDARFDAQSGALTELLRALVRSPPLPLSPTAAAAASASLLPPPAAPTASSISITLLLPDHSVVLRRFELGSDAATVVDWAATCASHHFGRPFSLAVVDGQMPGDGSAQQLHCSRGRSVHDVGLSRDCAVRMRWEDAAT